MKRALILAPLAAAGIALAACSSGSSGGVGTPTDPLNGTAGYNAPAGAPEPTATTPSIPEPTAKSFTVGLKTLSKHCFGSAGCSVTVQPTITYNSGPLSDLDMYACDVTYTIAGGSDGDTIETAQGQGGSRFSVKKSLVDTPSSSTELSAAVSDVSCQ
ncbi:MAG: hypothetical protein ACRDMV_10850 [Streptosporangiales bacterium]